jgi:hypothetical protein
MIKAYGDVPAQSVRAWVWELDGEILTVAGWYVTPGVAVVFSDMFLDNAPSLAVFRRARDFLKDVPPPAICEGTRKSRRFLEALGWEHMGSVADDVELFKWHS